MSQVHLFPPLLQVPGPFYLCNRQCVGDFETERDVFNLALIQKQRKEEEFVDSMKATFPPRGEWQCGELETSGCLHNDVAASGPGH